MSAITSFCIPDLTTGTCQWIFACTRTKKALVVDPVLDFNFDSGRTSTENLEKIFKYLKDQSLTLEWVLETVSCFFLCSFVALFHRLSF